METQPTDEWCIYAIFAHTLADFGVVKVGISKRPLERVKHIRQGSPFPLGAALFAPAGSRKAAREIERRIHAAFKERRTRGEWFKFNYQQAADKFLFHATTKAIYFELTKQALCWTKLTPAQLSGEKNRLTNGRYGV